MPRVPMVQGQTVMPGAAPTVFQRVQATPADFGAGMGQAVQQAVGQMDRVLERMNDNAIRIQRENDALAVEKTYATIQNEERAFLLDPEKGLYSRRGGNALTALDDATKWFDDRTRTAVEEMENPQQQRLLQQMLLRRRDAALDGVARHVARERQTYIGEATTARLNGLVADASAAWNDDGKVNGIIQEADGLVRFWGQRMGQSPEQVDLAARTARSQIRTGVIERMALTSPIAAQRYYEGVKADLDGATQEKVEKALRAGVNRETAQRAVATVMPKTSVEGGDIRERVWRLEGGEAQNPQPGQTARGGGITDGTWNQYAQRLGLKPEQRGTREGFDAVWSAYQQDAQAAVGRPLTQGEQYAAWFLGIGGAKAFLNAPRNADARQVYGQAAGEQIADQAFRVNGAMLRPGMTVGEVLDGVAGKVVGGTPGDREARVTGTFEGARRSLAAMRERGELSDEQLELAEARLTSEFSQRRQAEDDTRRAALKGVRETVYRDKSLDRLTPDQLAFLDDDPFEKQRLMDYVARQGRIETDFSVYNRLNNMRGTDEFEAVDLESPEYATKLSREDLKRFSDMQVAQRKGDNSVAARATKAAEAARTSIVRDRLREVGIDPTPRDTDRAGGERVRRFNDALDASIATWKANNPNKVITTDDIKKMADALLIQGEVLSGSMWRPDPNRRAFEMADRPQDERDRFSIVGFLSDARDRARVSRVTGVPADRLDEHVDALQKAGLQVTPDNIAALWRRSNGGR